MIESFYDFSGGFASTIPSPMLEKNELLEATNCLWDNGIVCRKGYTRHSTEDVTLDSRATVGVHRTNITGTPSFLLAKKQAGVGVTFWIGSTAFEQIPDFTWEESEDVRFSDFGNRIVAVNGVSIPIVFSYSDGTWTIEDLNSINNRVREDIDWELFVSDGATLTDETANIQSEETVTIYNGEDNNSFIIASPYVFTKVALKNISCATSPSTVTYEIYQNGAWAHIVPDEEIDWGFGGDQHITLAVPLSDGNLNWDPIYLDDLAILSGKYVMRVTFIGGTAITTNGIEVSMDQYMTLVFGGSFPHDIITHNNRIQVAVGNVVHFSQVNILSGWRADDIEYFQEGGDKIQRMLSFPLATVIMKNDAIYALQGNSYKNYVKRLVTHEGIVAPHSAVVMDQEVYYLSRDGVRGWNGSQSVLLSKHISNHVPSDDENAFGFSHEGRYYISFPSNDTVLLFDPDSGRKRDNGDAAVSFFKYTNFPFKKYVSNKRSWDDGRLYGFKDSDGIYLLEEGDTDDGTPVEMKVRTLGFTFLAPGVIKRLARIKVEVVADGPYEFSLEADNGSRSLSIPIESGSSGVHIEDITTPYQYDGRDLIFGITHDGFPGKLTAFHIEYHRRVN